MRRVRRDGSLSDGGLGANGSLTLPAPAHAPELNVHTQPPRTTQTKQIPKLLKPPDAVDIDELKRRIYDPAVKRQRHALGRLFRQFGLDQFRMSRYVLQHRQALFSPAAKREAMAALGGYEHA